MSAQISTEEMIESLTGFEEIAIAKAFGGEVFDLAQTKQTMFVRSLVFVHFKREGDDDKRAKEKAMGLTLGEAQGYFSDEDIESGEGEPPVE